MARAGLGRIRSAGPGTFARALDGHLGTATTSTPVALRQGAGPPGPSRWMASRCVTGRSERTLAEPPFGALAAAFVTLSLGTQNRRICAATGTGRAASIRQPVLSVRRAYAARAGMACDVYVPAATSAGKLAQLLAYGAAVHRIEGSRE